MKTTTSPTRKTTTIRGARRSSAPPTRTLARTAATLGAVGAGGLTWAFAETRMFTVRRHTVPVSLLPSGPTLDRPLRILHLADLHLMPRQRMKLNFLRSLWDEDIDVVINTGDNIAHRDSIGPLVDGLGPLLEVPGFFVFGSNDYYGPQLKSPTDYLVKQFGRGKRSALYTDKDEPPSRLPISALRRALTGGAWQELSNTRAEVAVDRITVRAVGVDDPHIRRDRFPHNRDGQESIDDGALALGVTHAPYQRVLNAMANDNCHLILAGHTHGGQLRLPGYGTIVTNCDLDRHRAWGLHGWPGARPDAPPGAGGGTSTTWLHTSAGLGTSPYTPVRFHCRPEATILTLV